MVLLLQPLDRVHPDVALPMPPTRALPSVPLAAASAAHPTPCTVADVDCFCPREHWPVGCAHPELLQPDCWDPLLGPAILDIDIQHRVTEPTA